MKRPVPAVLVAAFALLPRLYAPPPLITGDVPTAHARHFELYTGVRYQDTGRIQRQLPHAELVYGLLDRWEISVEGNYLSRAGAHGWDDFTLGTKAVLLTESAARPAVGVSYEYKFDNGDGARGLGSGGVEQECRLRAQKTFGDVTPIVNAGHVSVPDVFSRGMRSSRRNVWRASLATEWKAGRELKLLGESYWRTADEPGNPARLGWNLGFKQKLREGLVWHGAFGGSLRPGNRGGPERRVYLGLKYEFAAP